jgi:primosomal protein N' (replication factor Y)
MSRARVIVLNSALGPLDYRVPRGMAIAPGSSVVIAPLGPRRLGRRGVGGCEFRRAGRSEIGDNRLRNL